MGWGFPDWSRPNLAPGVSKNGYVEWPLTLGGGGILASWTQPPAANHLIFIFDLLKAGSIDLEGSNEAINGSKSPFYHHATESADLIFDCPNLTRNFRIFP